MGRRKQQNKMNHGETHPELAAALAELRLIRFPEFKSSALPPQASLVASKEDELRMAQAEVARPVGLLKAPGRQIG